MIADYGLRTLTRNPQSAIVSFIPQCQNGVQARCPSRRPDAKDNAYRSREEEGKPYRHRRDIGVPVYRLPQDGGRAHAEDHADQPAEQAQNDCFDQELEEDVDARGTERLSHADLARSLRHRDEHDVHDPDPADEQGDGRDPQEKDAEHLRGLLERREEVRLVADLEVVIKSRASTMVPQDDLLIITHLL